jgi:hypothetical protein
MVIAAGDYHKMGIRLWSTATTKGKDGVVVVHYYNQRNRWGRSLSITTIKGKDGVVEVHYQNQRKRWHGGCPLPQEKMGWLMSIYTTTKGKDGEGCCPLPQPKEKMGWLRSITTTKGIDGEVVVHYHNQRKRWGGCGPLPQPKEKMV